MLTKLSIETSGATCGACISIDGKLISVAEVYRKNVHEEQLQICVTQVLSAAGMAIDNVNVIAVSAGPGSFTGLRIGLSFVKGLCFDGSIKMLGIDTMQSLAWAAHEVAIASAQSLIHCIIPSHRDLYYIGSYGISETSSGPIQHGTVELVDEAEVQKRITTGLVCGPGAPFFAPYLEFPRKPISGLTRLSSRFVALAAFMRLQSAPDSYDDSALFEPLYRQEWVAMTSKP